MGGSPTEEESGRKTPREDKGVTLTPKKSNHEPNVASRATKAAFSSSAARAAQRLSTSRWSA